jgi:hypothetical protein
MIICFYIIDGYYFKKSMWINFYDSEIIYIVISYNKLGYDLSFSDIVDHRDDKSFKDDNKINDVIEFVVGLNSEYDKKKEYKVLKKEYTNHEQIRKIDFNKSFGPEEGGEMR